MEKAETRALDITTEWEHLDNGEPAEQACFARLSISAHGHWLTEGVDEFSSSVKSAPLLSAYHLAEWLAWNWWRLRWEPKNTSLNWSMAHCMANVGGGYVWPDITISSDGERTVLAPRPTPAQNSSPFRYISNVPTIMLSEQFADGIDTFIERVISRLNDSGVKNSNLDQIWASVIGERQNVIVARIRQLEALAGYEPDEIQKNVLQILLADSNIFGEAAVNELAAANDPQTGVLSGQELKELAKKFGFEGSRRDTVQLKVKFDANVGQEKRSPWQIGARLASQLREQESFGANPITDAQLAQLAAITKTALDSREASGKMSFALDDEYDVRFVFRSKWREGRRFELARILGDRLFGNNTQKLFPVTRSYTFRQKMQRSFAAELLSPFDAVDHRLAGDYSDESQKDVAEHFQVSEKTIKTMLVNRGLIPRDELDFEMALAM